MKNTLKRVLFAGSNRDILVNSLSLFGTMVINSVLGFFYWWFAARYFPETAVGFASAVISAMTLIGTMGMLGLGTLLMGELPRSPGAAGNLITTALFVSGLVSFGLGLLFALSASRLSADLALLSGSAYHAVVFAIGVVLTAVTLVLDRAFIGLLRGGLQLRRNIYFSAAKLAALMGVAVWLADRSGMTIYITWALGNLASLALIVMILVRRNIRLLYRAEWSFIGAMSGTALGHHALNLALLAPGLLLPVIVTVALSVELNASFYAAWTIAALAFAIPGTLTTVLYTVAAADRSELAAKLRLTLICSAAAGCATSILLLVGARPLLGLFGPTYAEQAAWCLRILGLGVFPTIIKTHYAAICRIDDQVTYAAKVMALAGVLELSLAAVGAQIGGLTGLSAGWLAALCIETLFMGMRIHRSAASLHLLAHTARAQK